MNRMYRILNMMTALFRWIGKLYTSLRTQVHLLFMPKALVCRLVKDPLLLDSLPRRIAFAQKRVVQRRSHNRKGALFTEILGSLRGAYLGTGRQRIGMQSQPARSAKRQHVIK